MLLRGDEGDGLNVVGQALIGECILIITAVLETNKIEPHVLFYYSMLMYSSIGLL